MSAQETNRDLTRIFPPAAGGGVLDARAAYGAIDFGAMALPERPYVVVNMVTTADGQARIGGDTDQLGGSADAQLFAALRECVDCVMAGVRTIGIEGYNAPARGPEVQARRRDNGLAPRPLVATITRSGELPLEAPIFSDADIRVVAFGAAEGVGSAAAADVVGSPLTDPAAVLRSLRADFGVRSVLLEGGPTLNTPFFADELIDELFLTVAPVLSGTEGPFPIIAGTLPELQKLHLMGALTADEHLFLRYRVD